MADTSEGGRTDWSDRRLDDLAATVKEFRRESAEQHKGLDAKIDKVADSIATEKDNRAAKARTVMLSAGVPILLFLLGILYSLASGG